MPAVRARVDLREQPQHLEPTEVAHDAHVEQTIVDDRVRHDAHAAAVARADADGDQVHRLFQLVFVQADAHARRGVVPQRLQDAPDVRQRPADELGHSVDAPGDLGIEAEAGHVDEVRGAFGRADLAEIDGPDGSVQGQMCGRAGIAGNAEIAAAVVAGAGRDHRDGCLSVRYAAGDFAHGAVPADGDDPFIAGFGGGLRQLAGMADALAHDAFAVAQAVDVGSNLLPHARGATVARHRVDDDQRAHLLSRPPP